MADKKTPLIVLNPYKRLLQRYNTVSLNGRTPNPTRYDYSWTQEEEKPLLNSVPSTRAICVFWALLNVPITFPTNSTCFNHSLSLEVPFSPSDNISYSHNVIIITMVIPQ